jgi:hypothetical protein
MAQGGNLCCFPPTAPVRGPAAPCNRDNFEAAIYNYTAGAGLESVLSNLNNTFAKFFLDPQQKQLRQLLSDIYLSTINYNNIDNLNGTQGGVSHELPPLTAYGICVGWSLVYPYGVRTRTPTLWPLAPQDGSGSGGSPSWLPIAIVLPTVGALLLIAAGVVYEVRNNRKHKNLFGKVVPPGVGPDTTILVSEIQVSAARQQGPRLDREGGSHHMVLGIGSNARRLRRWPGRAVCRVRGIIAPYVHITYWAGSRGVLILAITGRCR